MAAPLTARERKRLHQVVVPFGSVYRRVTERIRRRWTTLRASGRQDTARWLAYLVAHFRRHFRAWADNPDLATYLRLPIQPPVLAMAVPPVLLAWSPWIAGGALAAIPVAIYSWWLYEARIVNYLGYRVYVATVRSLQDMGRSRDAQSTVG